MDPIVHRDSGSFSELMKLALPLVVSFLSHAIMGIVDTWIVGKVGTAEQAGVGLGYSLSWGFISIFAGTFSVVTTFVSQYLGAQRKNEVGKWVQIGFLMMIPISILMLSIGYGIDSFIDLFGTNEEIRPNASTYLGIVVSGSPLFLLSFILISFFRGIGDTVLQMRVTVVANVFNMVLDAILVFGYLGFPAMGVKGAAIATVSAMGLSFLLYLASYLNKKHRVSFLTNCCFPLKSEDVAIFLKVGFPIGLSWFVEQLAFTVMTIYIGRSDAVSMASHAIVFQLISFSFMPAIAISIAAGTLVGRYIGAERKDIAGRSASLAVRFSVAFMATIGLCFILFGQPVVGLFNANPVVVRNGASALTIAAFFQLFDALGISVDGVFRGAGKTTFPMVVRLISLWFFFIPLVFVLGSGMGPLRGAWMAAFVGIFLQGMIMFGEYRRGKWMEKSLVHPSVE